MRLAKRSGTQALSARRTVGVSALAAALSMLGSLAGCSTDSSTSNSASPLLSVSVVPSQAATAPSQTTPGTAATSVPTASGAGSSPSSPAPNESTEPASSPSGSASPSASSADSSTGGAPPAGAPDGGTATFSDEAAGGSNGEPSSTTPNTEADAATPTPEVDTTPRPTVVAAPDTRLVKVDAALPHQTFEGWGTSLCWWANHVGGWSEAARDAVVDAVVDPVEGLGYNIFRYNIGGGENPSHSHMDEFRDMPGFQTAEGEWTWDADGNQRALLLSIVERGVDPIIEAFANSPPYWMTKSGCASGSSDGSNNLDEDSYDAFADYLTEVVRHYRDEYGVVFRTLEPLNEPNANWWKADGSQEGCHFSPANQERLIQAVDQQLADKELIETLISASDENSMDDALQNLRSFDPATTDAIGQLNVHSYAGTRRAELRELANSLGKRLWQSESGPLGQNISDDTDAALFMADRIIADLRELQAEAWVDWQAGDPARSWASFTLDDNQQTHRPLKRFYMHAGFSRYIRPGALFIDVDDDDMVAALSADGETLALVISNSDRNAERSFTFDLTSLPNMGSMVTAYRTSATEDLEPLAPIDATGYQFVATVPAFSVTTFVVPLH